MIVLDPFRLNRLLVARRFFAMARFAQCAGLSIDRTRDLFTGKAHPTPAEAEAIAKVLKCRVSDFAAVVAETVHS